MNIKNNLNFQKLQSFFESFPVHNELLRYVGVSDLVDGYKQYQKEEGKSALKCIGIGISKLCIVSAAFYGAYRWLSKEVVYLNDHLKEVTEALQMRPSEQTAPPATEALIQSCYAEQKRWNLWPKSCKEFFTHQLSSNAPMSAAIVDKMLTTAETRGDSSFQREATKACSLQDSSTLACQQVARTLTSPSHPKGSEVAVSIATRGCKKSNRYCQIAREAALTVAMGTEDFSVVLPVLQTLRSQDTPMPGFNELVLKMSGLFERSLDSFKEGILACYNAGQVQEPEKSPDWEKCYSHATWIDKIDQFDRPWRFGERFVQAKQRALRDELKSAVSTNGVSLALLCKEAACRPFVDRMVDLLMRADLLKEASRVLQDSPLLTSEPSKVFAKIESEWMESNPQAAIEFVIEFLKKHPGYATDKEIDAFVAKLLNSSHAHLALQFLALADAHTRFPVDTMLQKAFESQKEEHNYAIYLIAKKWIATKENNLYQTHLSYVINQLFSFSCQDSYWGYCAPKEMAQSLVTQIALSQNPGRWHQSDLQEAWALPNKRWGSRDVYHPDITKENWKAFV